jgi:hypothetical protein
MDGVLTTVMFDAFSLDRADEIASAIDEVCPPEGGGPFASSGLYAFWDPETRELLYIGLARDLGYRFRQHTGLVMCDPRFCKIERIRDHFAERELLGYSMMPQSPFDQADCARARADLEGRALSALKELGEYGEQEIIQAEGQLLEANTRRTGRLPAWNHIGGSVRGAQMATVDTEPFLNLLRAEYRHALTAKRTIRELAQDATAQHHESLLHVARFEMLLRHGAGDDDLLRGEVVRLVDGPDFSGAPGFAWLLESGYLDT